MSENVNDLALIESIHYKDRCPMAMASSSTLLSRINEDYLTCRICMDTYKDPKVLTCQHSFCLRCLGQFYYWYNV